MSPALLRAFVASARLPVVVDVLENMAADDGVGLKEQKLCFNDD